jgi:hypothetical protein
MAQEVVLVSAIANLDIRQVGSSSTKTDSVDGPFLLLPIGQLGAQIPLEGILVSMFACDGVQQVGFPLVALLLSPFRQWAPL